MKYMSVFETYLKPKKLVENLVPLCMYELMSTSYFFTSPVSVRKDRLSSDKEMGFQVGVILN